MTSFPRSTLYLSMSNNDFPRPINIGERRVMWLVREIEEWFEKKIKERDLAPIKEEE